MLGLDWRAWLGLAPRNLDAFAHLAQARLRQIRGERSTFSKDKGLLVVEGSSHRLIALDRAFEAYLEAPRRDRKKLLDRFLAPPPPFPSRDEALPNLLPAVRNRYCFANELRKAAQNWNAEIKVPPMRAIAEHVGLVLVHDEPSTVSLIGQEHLSTWSLEFEPTLERAIQNLRALSDAPWEALAPGLFLSPWSDFHDAARIALPDLFHRLPVRGAPVVTVPNRQTVLVTGDRDPRGLGALLEATRAMLAQDRPISGIPLRLGEDGWHSWSPDREATNDEGWSELRAKEVVTAYTLLKEVKAGGPEVPPVLALTHDARRWTGCFWPEGQSLLPSVDFMLFRGPAGELRGVQQSRLRSELPHLFQRSSDWPPLWQAPHPPSRSELEGFETTSLQEGA